MMPFSTALAGVLASTESVATLIPMVQTAVGPVILISGVGLLLLSMTNRLGRIIDRARALQAGLAQAPQELRAAIAAQLEILWTRACLTRAAISLAVVSALAAAVMIITLFLVTAWQWNGAWLLSSAFLVCLSTLIAALIFFLHDINRSLWALKLELQRPHTQTCLAAAAAPWRTLRRWLGRSAP